MHSPNLTNTCGHSGLTYPCGSGVQQPEQSPVYRVNELGGEPLWIVRTFPDFTHTGSLVRPAHKEDDRIRSIDEWRSHCDAPRIQFGH